ALDAWVESVASIDGVYRVYFDGTAVFNHWHEYRNAIYSYIYLVCSDNSMRAGNVSVVKSYLQKYSLVPPTDSPSPTDSRAHIALATSSAGTWTVLRSSPINDLAFRKTYESVGRKLLQRRGDLAKELRETHADGYSSGGVDFWKDVIPGW